MALLGAGLQLPGSALAVRSQPVRSAAGWQRYCGAGLTRGCAQDFEQGLLGVTQEELNEMDEDSVVAAVRAAEAHADGDYDACTHLSVLELESLPAHTLAEHESGAECSVCLAQMSCGQKVAALACGHTFHRPCILRWFARSRRCPYCRTSISRASDGGAGGQRETEG